jgi:hypothetical protein
VARPSRIRFPSTLPAANLSVTLTATSVADPTKSASAAIAVPQIPGIEYPHAAQIGWREIFNYFVSNTCVYSGLQDFPAEYRSFAG